MKAEYVYMLFVSASENPIPCKVCFSKRKSLGIEINADGDIIVRAPGYISKRATEAFIEEKRDWILKNREKLLAKKEASRLKPLTPLEEQKVAALKKRFLSAAKIYFPKRCEELIQLTGGHYEKITIRNQKTRWGSCSQTGTLSFNYRLMMAPPEVIDYVIVHELCHLTHMNHSKAFWGKVADILPDYAKRKQWLKVHGHELDEVHYLLSLM